MKFGPFSESVAQQLRDKLEALGIAHTLSYSESSVQSWQDRDRAREPSSYPRFQGLIEFIYFEIADADAARAKVTLEPFGAALADESGWELQDDQPDSLGILSESSSAETGDSLASRPLNHSPTADRISARPKAIRSHDLEEQLAANNPHLATARPSGPRGDALKLTLLVLLVIALAITLYHFAD